MKRSDKIALIGVSIAFLSLLKKSGLPDMGGLGDVGAAGGGEGSGLDSPFFWPGGGYEGGEYEPATAPAPELLKEIPEQPVMGLSPSIASTGGGYTPRTYEATTTTPTTTGDGFNIPYGEIALTGGLLGAGPLYRRFTTARKGLFSRMSKQRPKQLAITGKVTKPPAKASLFKNIFKRGSTRPGVGILSGLGLAAMLGGSGIEFSSRSSVAEGEKPASFRDILGKSFLDGFFGRDRTTQLSQAAATSQSVTATITRNMATKAKQLAETKAASEAFKTSHLRSGTTAKKGQSKMYWAGFPSSSEYWGAMATKRRSQLGGGGGGRPGDSFMVDVGGGKVASMTEIITGRPWG